MRIPIKTEEELQAMRVAGSLTAKILDMVGQRIEVGISTGDIDDWCVEEIKNANAIAAPLNYAPNGHTPFPKSICTSTNNQICHGIPSHNKILKSGDIVNVDITVLLDSFHADASRMYIIGKARDEAIKLSEVTKECLYEGIDVARAGSRLGVIGQAIEKKATEHGYSVVREFCGHGLGASFHEPPQVLHYATPDQGPVLLENMVFTIEPMINAGNRHIKILADGWTAVTKDRSLSAQWEHTIRITKGEAELLTVV